MFSDRQNCTTTDSCVEESSSGAGTSMLKQTEGLYRT
jgi:hypothetical protein